MLFTVRTVPDVEPKPLAENVTDALGMVSRLVCHPELAYCVLDPGAPDQIAHTHS